MRVDRDSLPNRKRRGEPPREPVSTLQSLRDAQPWIWFYCRNPDCGAHKPVAIVPLIIRLGTLYPVDEVRRNAICMTCGHRGAQTSMRSWCGSTVGFAPWPKRFVTDERGIAQDVTGAISSR